MKRGHGRRAAGWENNAGYHIAAILLVVVVAYSNVFQNGFASDDFDFIVNWKLTRDLGSLPAFASGAVPKGHEGVYRPLRSVFYALSYMLWGAEPWGYHLQSILVHAACSALVYLIACEASGKKAVGLLAGALFAAHPIHTEAITFMTTSFDVIGVMFYLASFYLYAREERDSGRRRLYLAASVALAAAAFFTYELTLTLPVMMALYDFCFRRKRLKAIAYAPYFAAAAAYLFVRFVVLGIRGRGGYFAGSLYHTMLTMTKAFTGYVVLTAVPLGLNVEHVMPGGISSHVGANLDDKAILAQSVFDPAVVFPLALAAGLLAAAAWGLRRAPAVSFGILWFMVGLAPVSNVVPQSVVMSEKYAYIASLGYCLIFASAAIYALDMLARRRKQEYRAVVLVAVSFVVLAYAGLTYERNLDWRDNVALWSKTAEQSPESAYPHVNLGSAYLKAGNLASAAEETRRALELNPKIAEARNNLGSVYSRQGRLNDAVEEYGKAVELDGGIAEARSNLGNAYARLRMYGEAEAELKRAIALDPGLAEAHNDLGNVYMNSGRAGLAKDEFNRALALNPALAEARANLGNLYAREGDLAAAEAELRKALELDPGLPAVHNDLGTIYLQRGDNAAAREEYMKAIKLDPNFAAAKANIQRMGSR